MATQVCEDCGAKLTVWNRSLTVPNKCGRCATQGGPKEWAAYFEKKQTTEEDIKGYPLFSTGGRMIALALIGLVVEAVAILVGYGNRGGTGGFVGALVGIFVIGLVLRWTRTGLKTRPFDRKRMDSFAFPYVLVLGLGCIGVLFAFAPRMGTPVSVGLAHYVVHVGPVEVTALTAMLVGWFIVALIGFLVGMAITAVRDRKYKATVLAYFQDWKQTQ